MNTVRFNKNYLLAVAAVLGLALIAVRTARSATFYGLYFQPPATASTCTTLNINVSIPMYANVPDDGATWTTSATGSVTDGINYGDGGFPFWVLWPTAGPIQVSTLLGIGLPSTTPGALTMPYDLTFSFITERDGVVVLTSTIAIHCSGGIAKITKLSTYEPSSGSAQKLDDRINWDAFSGPVALYCDDDTLKVYDDSQGDGSFLFSFSDWPQDTPAASTLLKQVGDVSLWQLDTGEFQINARPFENGKVYAFVFNGCPYDGKGYTANLDPNE